MPDVFGPFDGLSWAQAGWYRDAVFRGLSGVYGAPQSAASGGDLGFSASGLTITMALGRAHVRGSSYERTSTAFSTAVTANATGNPRKDRLVLRRNLTAKTVTPTVITGTPAASPALPALTQSEDGSWDLPLFSWTTPASSGTTLTAVTDERAWIGTTGGGELAFQSIAARDANFPSPVKGDTCTVNGLTHTHDGTAWRWSRRFDVNGTTDASGFLVIPHLLGATPTGILITPGPQGSDLLNRVLSVNWVSKDASNFTAYAHRDDTNTALGVNQIDISVEAFV